MNGTVLTTSADDLYNLVKSRKKISVGDASKILKLPINIVQSLIDFLVEEKIFGIEYKFTTPYVYISREKGKEMPQNINIPEKHDEKLITKDEFYKKANTWNVSPEGVGQLWKKYLSENMEYIKEIFYKKAESKNIQSGEIENLWNKYLLKLQ
jgi:hypothetical protein